MRIQNSSLYNEDLAPVPKEKRTWGTWNYAALWISMSLCIPTYMLASSLDRWRHELVAGDTHYFSRQYDCVDTDDLERTCRRKIWNSISCFCKSKFWREGCKYSCNFKSNCCLWMVWHSNMDRWICILPDDSVMDAFFRKLTTNISCFIWLTNRSVLLLFCFLVAEYVCCLSRCGKH